MDLRDLYQTTILDHNRQPRNFGRLAAANRRADGHNPLCGDKLKLELAITDGTISDLRWEGNGCAISQASASLMSESIKGKSVEDAIKLFDRFHEFVTRSEDTPPVDTELGKLAVFSGVREFPVRVKCATLAWHTLRAAVLDEKSVVSTE